MIMKTTRPVVALFSIVLLLAGLPAPAARGAAKDQSAPDKPGTLQLQVNVPPTWRPFLSDDVKDAFVSQVREAFRREGFKGEITEVDAFDEPSPGCCLLTINLTEWRMNRVGNIDCVFAADLQTQSKTRHLGLFSGMAFRWMNGPGRFALSETFGDAAQDAIRSLYRELADTQLVPGIVRR